MADLFIGGLVAHLVADWFFQNEWMAVNKVNPKHPAGYVHALIHLACLCIVWVPGEGLNGWDAAAAVALIHFCIDLRTVLHAWRIGIRQTTEGPMAPHVAIWQDQVAHILTIYVAAGVLAS